MNRQHEIITKIFIVIFFALSTSSCVDSDHNRESRYIGLNKNELWAELRLNSGSIGTAIVAYQYPDEGNLRYQATAMINRNDSGNIPEVFLLAKKWRWGGIPDGYFYYFLFDSENKVASVDIDTSWRP
uniref:Uncharacterized protein n=1 Tax=Candidatus Kentrum sp. FW TaxID=2126338 RepID=A0A450TE40_9GAMM|nr:MAG: hypothetical protein BECKFW1821B_GA0114236_11028 [Candidatus Kentron sp. FW]